MGDIFYNTELIKMNIMFLNYSGSHESLDPFDNFKFNSNITSPLKIQKSKSYDKSNTNNNSPSTERENSIEKSSPSISPLNVSSKENISCFPEKKRKQKSRNEDELSLERNLKILNKRAIFNFKRDSREFTIDF